MNDDELNKYLEFAKTLAKQAGDIMLEYFRADHQVEIKSDNSPVTIADKKVNTLVIDQVIANFPEHGVQGEEESFNQDADFLWVCDPIDGTFAYTYHMPVAMFSLALVQHSQPVVAVAYNPFTKDLYYASKAAGAYRNDVRISVSDRSWGSAVIVRSDSSRPDDLFNGAALQKQIKVRNNKLPQTYGCVFKGCLVAEGSADAHLFPGSNAHDIAAIKLIVDEAGGKVTDLEGKQQTYRKTINGAILSNGVIHENLVNILSEYAHSGD